MTTTRRILVPVDFSASSYAAASFAVFLARKLGASLRLLHVLPPLLRGAEDRARAQAGLSDLIEIVNALGMQSAEASIEEGHPLEAIVHASAAEDCQLIVIGAASHAGFIDRLIGTITDAVVEHAACPVVVVHGQKAPETFADADDQVTWPGLGAVA
jgi:nucleotide-binding universal stress UspA family protein